MLETLKPLLPGRIVMCVGNIHGSGEPILHALLEYGRLPLPEPISAIAERAGIDSAFGHFPRKAEKKV